MEALQRGLPGAHAQSQHTVCKVFPNEPVLALIPLQPMAEMTVWDCQQRVKIAPPKQMDAQVRRLWSTYQGKRGLERVASPTLHIVCFMFWHNEYFKLLESLSRHCLSFLVHSKSKWWSRFIRSLNSFMPCSQYYFSLFCNKFSLVSWNRMLLFSSYCLLMVIL